MPIKSHIVDPSTGLKAAVVDNDEKCALVVATRPYKLLSNQLMFFADPDGSIDMNIAVGFGAPIEIHDGGDRPTWAGVADWVFSIPAGNPANFDETSTDHAKNAAIIITNNAAINAGDTITITTTAAVTVLTEGVEWTKGGNAAATINSIATAIDAIATLMSEDDGIDIANFYIASGFDITSIAFSGAGMTGSAQSVNFVNGVASNIIQFTSSVGDIDLSGYTAITGCVYITKWHSAGMTIQGYDDGTGPLGVPVNIVDYIPNVTNTWLKFTIPLIDMGISGLVSTFDALRFTILNNNFEGYLDYVELQASGGVDITTYTIKPDKGTWLRVNDIRLAMADALDTTLANASMSSLSYNKFLGVNELTSGILYQRIQNNVVMETIVLKSLGDWLQLPTTSLNIAICDGTNTFISSSAVLMEPVVLKSENGDELRVIISDDLSGLLMFRISCACGIEDRSESK